MTDEQVEKLVNHVKVDNFSKNESVNMAMEIKAGLANEGYTFIRKGNIDLNITYVFSTNFYLVVFFRDNWRLEKSFQPRNKQEDWCVDREKLGWHRFKVCYWAIRKSQWWRQVLLCFSSENSILILVADYSFSYFYDLWFLYNNNRAAFDFVTCVEVEDDKNWIRCL